MSAFLHEYAARDWDIDGACAASGVDVDEALDYLESEAGARALARAQRRRGLSVALGDQVVLRVATDPETPGRERLEAARLIYQRFGEDGASRQAEAMERTRLSGLTPQEYWLYVRDLNVQGLTIDARVLAMAEGRPLQLAVPIPRASSDMEAGDEQLHAARGLLGARSIPADESPREDSSVPRQSAVAETSDLTTD